MNKVFLTLSFLMGLVVLASNYLVQLYTGMVYRGPHIASKISKELIDLLKNKGFKNVSQAIGTKN